MSLGESRSALLCGHDSQHEDGGAVGAPRSAGTFTNAMEGCTDSGCEMSPGEARWLHRCL